MKLLVTGASGFVGKSLVRALVMEQYEVYGLARSDEASQVVIKSGATPIHGDLLAVREFKHKIKGFDTIIHAGAKIGFVGNFDDYYGINVLATKDLLDVAIKADVKKFIYISAAAIALNGKPLQEVTEEYQADNIIKSNYLISKVLAEQEILQRNKDIQAIIFRPPIIWGSEMGIIEEFRNTIQMIGFPAIGNVHHHLATCHVQNLISAIILSLRCEKARGIFLVCDNEKVVAGEFLRELLKKYDLDMGKMRISRKMGSVVGKILEYIWRKLQLKGNPPLSTFMVHLMGTEFTIDDTKIRNTLGYKPVISVEEGLHSIKSSIKK